MCHKSLISCFLEVNAFGGAFGRRITDLLALNLYQQHKFYLAFENSHCEDYISGEDLNIFHSLSLDSRNLKLLGPKKIEICYLDSMVKNNLLYCIGIKNRCHAEYLFLHYPTLLAFCHRIY